MADQIKISYEDKKKCALNRYHIQKGAYIFFRPVRSK